MKAFCSYRSLQIQRRFRQDGQAIVELAIVLPILLALLVGIMEVGRMVFMYAAVNNASREAVRYASAVGFNDSGTIERYKDCAGVKSVATRAGFLVSVTTTIAYDHGPGTGAFDTCDGATDAAVFVNSGADRDRVTVTVSATYRPMVNLVPISQRTLTSISSRTIFGTVELSPAATPTAGGGGGGATPTATNPVATTVPSSTPTPTATFTATPGQVYTFTPMITPSITLLPSSTATATQTNTPTATATSICANVAATTLDIRNKNMSTTITNPNGFAITVVSVRATWNAASGTQSNGQLALKRAQLGSTSFWTGTDTSGNLTITPPLLTIPSGGTPTTLTFTFAFNYKNTNGSSITLNLSAPTCGSFSITTVP